MIRSPRAPARSSSGCASATRPQTPSDQRPLPVRHGRCRSRVFLPHRRARPHLPRPNTTKGVSRLPGQSPVTPVATGCRPKRKNQLSLPTNRQQNGGTMAESGLRELLLPQSLSRCFVQRDDFGIARLCHRAKQDQSVLIQYWTAAERHIERVWHDLDSPHDRSLKIKRGQNRRTKSTIDQAAIARGSRAGIPTSRTTAKVGSQPRARGNASVPKQLTVAGRVAKHVMLGNDLLALLHVVCPAGGAYEHTIGPHDRARVALSNQRLAKARFPGSRRPTRSAGSGRRCSPAPWDHESPASSHFVPRGNRMPR